jgi:hypothetical protein
LEDNVDTHATDHSTIVTNGMHAEMAMAYDMAIGVCDIRESDFRQFRIAADWRFVRGLDNKFDPQNSFDEYFRHGTYCSQSTYDWAHNPGEGAMATDIVNARDGAILLQLGKFF